jgi:predicted amidohydrolase
VNQERPFDLVLIGGHVVDPASAIDAPRDVAVRDGRVAAVADSLADASAREVVDVTGRLVLPGLIDTHAHVYQHVSSRFGLNADIAVLADARGRFLFRDNSGGEAVGDRLLSPVFCLIAGQRVDAEAPILPRIAE